MPSSPGLGLRLLSRVYLTFSAYVAHRQARYPTPAAGLPPPLNAKGYPASGELNARRPEHKKLPAVFGITMHLLMYALG
jgi:hypothetical protein